MIDQQSIQLSLDRDDQISDLQWGLSTLDAIERHYSIGDFTEAQLECAVAVMYGITDEHGRMFSRPKGIATLGMLNKIIRLLRERAQDALADVENRTLVAAQREADRHA